MNNHFYVLNIIPTVFFLSVHRHMAVFLVPQLPVCWAVLEQCLSSGAFSVCWVGLLLCVQDLESLLLLILSPYVWFWGTYYYLLPLEV